MTSQATRNVPETATCNFATYYGNSGNSRKSAISSGAALKPRESRRSLGGRSCSCCQTRSSSYERKYSVWNISSNDNSPCSAKASILICGSGDIASISSSGVGTVSSHWEGTPSVSAVVGSAFTAVPPGITVELHPACANSFLSPSISSLRATIGGSSWTSSSSAFSTRGSSFTSCFFAFLSFLAAGAAAWVVRPTPRSEAPTAATPWPPYSRTA
mmetsp:Transcript_189/g.322  ORF Transcript_189/g.322 Transcript_189/m.322 type:complete len:215 (+) Transcript_189:42-686(+)